MKEWEELISQLPLSNPNDKQSLNAFPRDTENWFNSLCAEAPIPICWEYFWEYPNAKGRFDKDEEGLCICINDLLEGSLAAFKVAIHELAHYHLHYPFETNEFEYDVKEIEAEATAYLCCKYLNFDTSRYSFHYILEYGKENTLDILNSSKARILSTTFKILNHCTRIKELNNKKVNCIS